MPTQNHSICSHNLPRLSRSPLIPSRDGTAASAASRKSAALLPLAGAATGVLDRAFLVSFRKRKLSIGGYTLSLFENQRVPLVKLPILARIVLFTWGNLDAARHAGARRGASGHAGTAARYRRPPPTPVKQV